MCIYMQMCKCMQRSTLMYTKILGFDYIEVALGYGNMARIVCVNVCIYIYIYIYYLFFGKYM